MSASRRFRAGLGVTLSVYVLLMTLAAPATLLGRGALDGALGHLRLDTTTWTELLSAPRGLAGLAALAALGGLALTVLVAPALTWLWIASLDLDGGGLRGSWRRARARLLPGLMTSYVLGWLRYGLLALAALPAVLHRPPAHGLPDDGAGTRLALTFGVLAAAWLLGGLRDATLAALVSGHGIGAALWRALRAVVYLPAFALLSLLALGLRAGALALPAVLGGPAALILGLPLLFGATLARAYWLATARHATRR